MKKKFYLSLVISAILFGCTQRSGNSNIAEVPLVLTGDSGYFTKSQALPYLLSKGLTDTNGAYWHNDDIRQSDTIGKYFRANQPGHYIALFRIFDRQDSAEGLALIDFAEDGEMNNHEFYSTVDYYCDEDAIQSFTKKGRYFILFGCGHGSGYGSSYMYIFDKVLPEDSLNTVWDQIYSSTSLNFTGYSELLTSAVEVKNDSLLLHYQLSKGTYHKKATEWKPMKKVDVCYVKENTLWHATDSSFLNKISSLFY